MELYGWGRGMAAIPTTAMAANPDSELAATPIDLADPMLVLWAKRQRLRKEVKRMEQLGKNMDDDPMISEFMAVEDQIAFVGYDDAHRTLGAGSADSLFLW